jgi:hypothetical protein
VVFCPVQKNQIHLKLKTDLPAEEMFILSLFFKASHIFSQIASDKTQQSDTPDTPNFRIF